MTILGNHTVDETVQLMKTIDFRVQQANLLYHGLSDLQLSADSSLPDDWQKFQDRWTKAREKAKADLLALNVASPLVPASMVNAEFVWKNVMCAENVGCGNTYTKGDLTDCIGRIEALANKRIDESNAPQPGKDDPDLSGYQAIDASIKQGEAAAAAAAKGAGNFAKSNIGLMIGGGIALIITGGVLAKVYLP